MSISALVRTVREQPHRVSVLKFSVSTRDVVSIPNRQSIIFKHTETKNGMFVFSTTIHPMGRLFSRILAPVERRLASGYCGRSAKADRRGVVIKLGSARAILESSTHQFFFRSVNSLKYTAIVRLHVIISAIILYCFPNPYRSLRFVLCSNEQID